MPNIQGLLGGAMSGASAGASTGNPYVAAGGGIVGGLLGLFSGGDEDYEKQMQILQQIQSDFNAIPVPSVEAQEIVLERYRSAGLLTPEMESVIKQGPSAMEQISIDPRLRQAQMGALAKLQQRGEEGFTPVERAEAAQLSRQVAQQEQARQQAILREMQQRGIGGSGAELAAALSSSQAAAERQAQEADRLKAQAYQNALSAIAQSGQLAGDISGQQFSQQAEKFKATDIINAANIANARAVQSANVGARNQAQAANLANQQQIMNANVDLANKQQMYNKQLLQQRFQNELAKQQAKSGAGTNVAQMYGQKAQQDDKSWGSTLSGIATAAPALVGAFKGSTPAPRYDQYGRKLVNTQTGQYLADEDFDNELRVAGAKKVGTV